MHPIDQIRILAETGRDGFCQLARLAIESHEKMVGLGIDAAEELLADSGHATGRACAELADIEPSAIWPALALRHQNWCQEMAEASLRIGQQWQGEVTATGQAQWHVLAAAMQEECNKFILLAHKLGSVLVEQGEAEGRRVRLAA